MKMLEQMTDLPNYPWALGFVLAVVLAIVLELGFRVGAHYRIHQDSDHKDQMSTLRDGLFVLVSLLLGFTLALAASRYIERRSLLVEEAISIGTTYLRAGTLPQPYRARSQNLLREYVDARLDLDSAGMNVARITEASHRSKGIQTELWTDAAAVAQSDRTAITAVYINSLNETIDLYDKRIAASENRIPGTIWLLIFSVSVLAVFTRGLPLQSRYWSTLVLVPVTIAIAVALIADLDTPSRGLIRIDQRAMQRLKVDLSPESAH